MTNKELKRRIFLKAAKDYRESRIQLVLKANKAYTREQAERMTDRQISLIAAACTVED